ncbi:MAG: CinA family nicotinamide mononucleotide deamidase-related protein [Tannerella sp.]|jgi:nicotinamide-nucleotide amidase|nr:CinA family nicotinamide mononucleotide deamidase-related protein [Tannerella sp.]
MEIAIITIGDELLIGQVIDTNAAFMANVLNENGFRIVCKIAVGDVKQDIISAIETAKSKAGIVLITGGLGPTKDDITLRTLCDFFGCELHFSESVYANIERLFSGNGSVMNPLTRNQAMVPDQCTVIQNQLGTAPCIWFERNGFVLVSMPGVPFEMEWLMTNEIVPRLKEKYQRDIYILHHTYWVSGFSESSLALLLDDFESRLPCFVKLAYLPQSGIIRLRLSVYAKQADEADKTVNELKIQLESLLGEHIIVDKDMNLEVWIGEKLRERHMTAGTAESCTGGAIASLLTSVPGSSDYFPGSIVAYANSVKQQVLGVSSNDLAQYGAVSKTVVEQMARGALRVLNCDYAIATSGIAGPGGGTAEKPAGTVWIAVANKNRVVSEVYSFHTNRTQNIKRAVTYSLLALLEMLNQDHKF